MVKGKKLKLKPSARDKRRYFLVKANNAKVESAILEYIGVLGFAKSAYMKVNEVGRRELRTQIPSQIYRLNGLGHADSESDEISDLRYPHKYKIIGWGTPSQNLEGSGGRGQGAGARLSETGKRGFIIGSCLVKSLEDVRAALALAGIKIEKVSGTLKGLKR